MLTDAAFYVEEGDCTGNSWFAKFPSCKLYTPGTLSVIKEIRKIVDEVSASSSRPKYFLTLFD